MKLSVNGEATVISTDSGQATLEMVLNQLGHHPQSIVVEYNGVIINRNKWAEKRVHEGDEIEIVTIVGGGS